MESKNLHGSPVSTTKTLRVVLSPKVVRDFFIRNNNSSDSNQMQDTNGHGRESSASNSIEQTSKKNIHDSEIVDSNGMKPIILLDWLTPNELQNISLLGYMQYTNQTNGY